MTDPVIYRLIFASYFCRKISVMINMNLLLAEYTTPDKGEKSKARLEAIASIKEILSQIDYSAEKLPLNDSKRFIDLLTSLKGCALSFEEKQLALEISG